MRLDGLVLRRPGVDMIRADENPGLGMGLGKLLGDAVVEQEHPPRHPLIPRHVRLILGLAVLALAVQHPVGGGEGDEVNAGVLVQHRGHVLGDFSGDLRVGGAQLAVPLLGALSFDQGEVLGMLREVLRVGQQGVLGVVDSGPHHESVLAPILPVSQGPLPRADPAHLKARRSLIFEVGKGDVRPLRHALSQVSGEIPSHTQVVLQQAVDPVQRPQVRVAAYE